MIRNAHDLQVAAQTRRRNVTILVAGRRVRCLYHNSDRTTRFEIDQYRVPAESVDALMIAHPPQQQAEGRYESPK